MAFTAKYEGRCDDCHEAIMIGELIVQKPNGRYAHDLCPDVEPDYALKPGEVVCDTCFLVKPCACEVG